MLNNDNKKHPEGRLDIQGVRVGLGRSGEGGGRSAIDAFDHNQARIPEGHMLRRTAATLSAPPGDPSLPPRTGEEVRAVHVPPGAGLAARGAWSGDLSLVLADLDDLRVGLLDQPLALLVSQLADEDGVPKYTAVDADGRSLDVAQDTDGGLERPVILLMDTKLPDVYPLLARYVGCVVHVQLPLW